ncbi:head completion/stabilization protein [Pasteurella sp. PK-2025]|uniref:head completion/stabilization protein n=1 Tax=Pasteurella sp. PK-2025 TaxID=3413133 RepID=UPI003C727CD4
MFNGRNQQLENTVILNSGFWADVNIGEFQKERNIPLQMPVETVKSALVTAMQELELDLKEVEQRYKTQGINDVSEIGESTVNNENPVQTLYKKAVFARAKADLLPEFFAISAREIHQNREYVEEQKSLLAEATRAIRTLKGKKRGSVHLL